LRVRWYGSHANPVNECWIERKTRQAAGAETSKIDDAVKERFRIKSSNVAGYISGEWRMEKKLAALRRKNKISDNLAHSILATANPIQGISHFAINSVHLFIAEEEIISKQLKPTLRTVVRRSAFQQGADEVQSFHVLIPICNPILNYSISH
jgi:SPX domain protein involved in polyphosphate accumulation